MLAILVFLAAIAIVMTVAFVGHLLRNQDLARQLKDSKEAYASVVSSYTACYDELQEKYERLQEKMAKTVHQKKSSEVRVGFIAEQMAPFLNAFPYKPKSACFLGKPIDFVVFDDNGVHFVEVKSGKAQLTSKQRKIRDQIKKGDVSFEVYRIKGE